MISWWIVAILVLIFGVFAWCLCCVAGKQIPKIFSTDKIKSLPLVVKRIDVIDFNVAVNDEFFNGNDIFNFYKHSRREHRFRCFSVSGKLTGKELDWVESLIGKDGDLQNTNIWLLLEYMCCMGKIEPGLYIIG